MSFGKQKSKERLDPAIKGGLLANIDRTQAIADRPYQPYTGERVAGFTPTQLGAQQASLDFSNAGVGSGLLSTGAAAAGRAANYQPALIAAGSYSPTFANGPAPIAYRPASVTNAGYQSALAASAGGAGLAAAAQIDRGGVRDVTGGAPIGTDQINGYLNPYLQNVVDTSLADLERQRLIEQAQVSADARRQHAFGGTGAAVAAGLTNDTFARQAAQTASGLRSQGYDTALSAAQADAGRSLQAALANQGVDLSVAGTNAGLANSVGLANQSAGNQRAEFNAGLAQQGFLANQGAANAAMLANADAANRLAQANAQGQFSADSTNAGIGQSLSLANAAAGNQAAQFGAQQGYDAQLANQQAGQSAAALNLQGAQALAVFSDQQRNQLLQDIAQAQSVGDAQQKVQQALLDAGYSAYQAAQQYPLVMQQLLNSSIALAGNPTLTSSSKWDVTIPTGPSSIPKLPTFP